MFCLAIYGYPRCSPASAFRSHYNFLTDPFGPQRIVEAFGYHDLTQPICITAHELVKPILATHAMRRDK